MFGEFIRKRRMIEEMNINKFKVLVMFVYFLRNMEVLKRMLEYLIVDDRINWYEWERFLKGLLLSCD